MDSYITIHHAGKFQYEDKKSLFIGEACPVQNEAQALAFIDGIKKKYPDANHHVYAYMCRENSIMRFSDDREPQGTAGMPVLDVMRKRSCTNAAIVVVRYFGGTLLGTGGLVRAYTAAAQGALQNSEIIKYDIYSEIRLVSSYSDYQKISVAFDKCDFFVTDVRYTDNVEITGKILKSRSDELFEILTQISAGRIKFEIISEKYDFL